MAIINNMIQGSVALLWQRKNLLLVVSFATILLFALPVELQAKVFITLQPVGFTKCEGAQGNLTCSAGTLAYQWYKGGIPIPGATSNTLSINSLQTIHSGLYKCKCSNSLIDYQYTVEVTVTVLPAPDITRQPVQYLENCQDVNTYMDLSATSGYTLYFKWYKNGSTLVSTGLSVLFEPLEASDAGDYHCVVSHSGNTCTATSQTGSVQVFTKSTSPASIQVYGNPTTLCEGTQYKIQGSDNGTLGNYAEWNWYTGNSAQTLIGKTKPWPEKYYIPTVDTWIWVRAEDGMCPNSDFRKILLDVKSKPTISYASATTSLCEDEQLMLNVNGTLGDAPGSTWKWYLNGSTSPFYSSTLNTNWVTPPTTGVLSLAVKADGGACGSTSLKSTSSTVHTIPYFTGNPVSQNVCEGETVTFSSSASGSGNKQYRWWKDGIYITGWRSYDTIKIQNVNSEDAGSYKCYVTNECGKTNIYSSSASLSIKLKPKINSISADVEICEGSVPSVGFSINDQGASLTYQWEIDEGAGFYSILASGTFSGTKSSQLTITNPDRNYNNSRYRCVVNGACVPSATSEFRTLIVNTNPEWLVHPQSQLSCLGETLSIPVKAAGTEPIYYEWKLNGSPVFGPVTDLQYTISSIQTANGGNYTVRAFNDKCGNADSESNSASIIVRTPPQIISQPNAVNICEGTSPSVDFTVSATGSDLLYQWQLSEDAGENWTDLGNIPPYSGANSNVLKLADPNDSLSGFMFKCHISGSCAPSEYSDPVSLTVKTSPSIDIDPMGLSKCTGQTATFTISATGTEPIQYQWTKDDISITGFVQDTFYSIEAVGLGDAGNYNVKVINECSSGPIYSDDAQLSVKTAPSIVDQPDHISMCEGEQSKVMFSTLVSGSGFSHQWEISTDSSKTWADLQNGLTYENVTTGELTVNSPGALMSGHLFRCKIAGVCDPPVTTDNAILSVKSLPQVSVHPVNDTVCQGETAHFEISATGTAPLKYKWKKGGKSITDWFTDDFIILEDVGLEDNENVMCQVSNECATINNPVNSDEASLFVNPAPFVSLGADKRICTGSSTILDPGSSYNTYEWSTDETTQAIVVDLQGIYKVVVTDIHDCKGDDAIFIILDPSIPPVNLGMDASYCAGEQLTLDAGAGYDAYEWSDGTTGQTLDPPISNTYWVRASNNNTLCEVTDTINIIIAEPFDGDQICIVTVDLATGKNMVVWEKTSNQGIVAYKIYRETKINQYDEIGTVAAGDLSIFKDLVVSPENRAYLYKIQAIDTCGNASDLTGTPYHKPIFLKYVSSDAGVNLTWTDYEIEDVTDLGDYLTAFEIYRGSDSTDLQFYKEVGSVNDYLDTDIGALSNHYWYRVAGVLKDPCYPSDGMKAGTGPYVHSLSNMDDNKLRIEDPGTGLGSWANTPILVYPNPFSEYATIRFENPEGRDYTLYISDLSGKVIRIVKEIRSEEITLYRENLKPGYYHLELLGERLYRSKLIVK